MKQKATSEDIDYTVVVEILLLNFEAIESHYVLLTMLSALTRATKSLGRRILWDETIWNRLVNSLEVYFDGEDYRTLKIKNFYNLSLGDHLHLCNLDLLRTYCNSVTSILLHIRDAVRPSMVNRPAVLPLPFNPDFHAHILEMHGSGAINSVTGFLRTMLNYIVSKNDNHFHGKTKIIRDEVTAMIEHLQADAGLMERVERAVLSALLKNAWPLDDSVGKSGPYKLDRTQNGIIEGRSVALNDASPLPRSYNLYFLLTGDADRIVSPWTEQHKGLFNRLSSARKDILDWKLHYGV